MSHHSRRIIKARRNHNRHYNEDYDKCNWKWSENKSRDTHGSVNPPYENRRGAKRAHEEKTHTSPAKKQCTTAIKNTENAATPKNSANARLAKLKDSLKKSKSNNNTVIEPSPQGSTSYHTNNNHIEADINESPRKFNTTPVTKKNGANERLLKLRQSLEISKTIIDLTHSPAKMETNKIDDPVPSCSKSTSTVQEAEKSECAIDRNALTNSWLNNNVRTMDASIINTEPEESLLVNVNDSVAELHRLHNLDQSDDMEWNSSFQNINNEPVLKNANPSPSEPVEKIKNLCIIVDTNIFLSHLKKLEEILNMRTEGSLRPIIYIPWMVNVELDFIKDQSPNKNLKLCAQDAIRFIQSELKFPDSRIVGQTVLEASRQIEVGTSPDDKIIACCFQVSEKYENILVLSNDVHLRNKCIINKFPTCSANEARIKIVTLMRRNIKSMKVISKMSFMLSSVIKKCMQEKFGDNWNKKELLNNYPWQLIDCARIIKRYWLEVFKQKLLKQCLKTVDEIFGFLAMHNFINDDSKDFEEFMKLCITLCIFLKDIKECTETVDNTLKEISSI